MKHIAMLGLVLMMFILTGCPQETNYTVHQGSYDVPAWLSGTWTEVSTPNTVYYLEKDKKYGVVRYTERKKSDSKPEAKAMKEVILCTVGKKIYAFVPDPEEGEIASGYYLYEYRPVSNKEFTLIGIKEKSFERGASPYQLGQILSQDKDILDMADMRKFVKN